MVRAPVCSLSSASPLFHDIGEQNIHERMLAVERCAALVLGVNNPLDRREIELAEGVVLRPKQTSAPSIGLSRIDPTIHDSPANECLYPQALPRREAAIRPCCEALHRRQALSAALGALPFGIDHPRATSVLLTFRRPLLLGPVRWRTQRMLAQRSSRGL